MHFIGIEIAEEATFAVTAFGISQLLYATVFTFIMYHKAAASLAGIGWPKLIKAKVENPYRHADDRRTHSIRQHFDLNTLHLVLMFTLQGVFKHALTEADKIILSALAGSYDQGVYALASSYGGLAARLLLQPMEENARLLFSRQGALIAKEQSTNDGENDEDGKNDASNLSRELENTYCLLLRGVLYIGLVFAAIATNYTSLLLKMLAGDRWGSNSEASDALSAFCIYTAFLALNGTTEALVFGVARSGKDVGQLGLVHAVIGGVFALISPGLVRSRGAVGLVAANCICMGLRSTYSLYYACKYFTKFDGKNNRLGVIGIVTKVIPHPMVLAAFGASFAITNASMTKNYAMPIAQGVNWLVPALTHISIGVACAIMVTATALYLEDDIRAALFSLVGRKCTLGAQANTKTFSVWYSIQIKQHEILCKSITAGILAIFGDMLAQGIEHHLDRGGKTTITDAISSLLTTLDKRRTLAMFGDGLFTGPLLHFIFEMYERLLPLPDEDQDGTRTWKISWQRFYISTAHVLIDNSVMALIYVFLTMCTTAALEGHYETIPDELRNDFVSAVRASWNSSLLLAPAQLFSFLVLPKEFRVLAVNVQDIAWVAVISYATHLNRH
jgi:hypothetical protein